MKNENASLKASNDNHIFINEKLNKALQKIMLQKTKAKDEKSQIIRGTDSEKKARVKEEAKEEKKEEKKEERKEIHFQMIGLAGNSNEQAFTPN